jgi:hypothetical protein
MRQFFPDLPSKTRIAALIFVLCCLLSTVRILKDAPGPTRPSVDDIARRSDLRFAALRAALPQHGVVGYIGNPRNSAAADYYLAQYALAPLVIDHSVNHPLVVGNFIDSPPLPAPSNNLRLVRDFGNGVVLFAGKDAR